ncbi:CTLH/CRA C-terminal to lish motif domain-containing protein [Mrakia frigida]|uniref:glucose-induced degradation complex subunit FYV10 n=1 Tax=Mrakia frigida TaxID=29902 RepID=UPI003FCBFC5F
MSTSTKLTREHLLLLEDQVLKTPLELLRRSFRTSQRSIEKDFIALNGLIGELKKSNGEGEEGGAGAGAGGKLDGGIERIKGLKRKLSDLLPSPSHPSAMRPRLEHLSKVDEMGSMMDQGFEEYSEKRLLRYIVDYLIRTGRHEEAKGLAKSRGIEDLVDIDLFLELQRIEKSIQAGSCSDALAWCGENRGTLKKMKNTLEFSLRLQEYIELCRSRSILPALAYLKKHLASTTGGGWAETHGAEIKRALVLLTVDEESARSVGAYASLYSPKRWHTLSTKFTSTFQNLYSLPSAPLLSTSLAAGLSALKLPHCSSSPSLANPSPSPPPTLAQPQFLLPSNSNGSFYYPSSSATPSSNPNPQPRLENLLLPHSLPLLSHPDASNTSNHDTTDESHNFSCPTCSLHLGFLAKEVPGSHNVNSVVVCRISGKVMDDGIEGGTGGAMAFPNGYVYSYGALQEMAEQDEEGKVTCPRSGYRCEFGELRKVFLS